MKENSKKEATRALIYHSVVLCGLEQFIEAHLFFKLAVFFRK